MCTDEETAVCDLNSITSYGQSAEQLPGQLPHQTLQPSPRPSWQQVLAPFPLQPSSTWRAAVIAVFRQSLEQLQQSRLQLFEHSRLHLPERPRLQLPEQSRLHLPEQSRLQLSEQSRLHLSEQPRLQLPEQSRLQLQQQLPISSLWVIKQAVFAL